MRLARRAEEHAVFVRGAAAAAHVAATYAIRKLEGKDPLRPLRRALYQVLARALGEEG